jgi:nucleoside-diphosphate-sugar epimerase
MTRVAILGCGYIGLELGRQLTARGHEVVGVRRSPEGCESIEDAGFRSVRADLTDPDDLARVPDADVLVFAASSGGRDAAAAREVYVRGLETVLGEFSQRADPPERLLYTSSTGVYGDHDGGWVDEETEVEPTTEKTRVLREAEEVALDSSIAGTVVRFAGLYGPDRYRLERYLEGPVTEGYLNMIHREDAAGTVRYLIEEGLARGEVVLAVDDEPASKWDFADWLAEQCGVSEPGKETKEERLSDPDLSEPARRRLETSKRCSNERLQELGYEFSYPTYREGYHEAVKAYPSR